MSLNLIWLLKQYFLKITNVLLRNLKYNVRSYTTIGRFCLIIALFKSDENMKSMPSIFLKIVLVLRQYVSLLIQA